MDFRLASDAHRLSGIGWLQPLAGLSLLAANERVRDPNASGQQEPAPFPDGHRQPATADFSSDRRANSRGPREADPSLVARILSTIAGQGPLGCPGICCAKRSPRGSRPTGNQETLLAELAAKFGVLAMSRKKSKCGCAASTGSCGWNSPCGTTESKPIHRVIPKRADRPREHALTCHCRAAAYHLIRSVAFGSAECDHRQDQMGLGAAAATGVASRGEFDPGSKLRVAAQGTCRAGASSPVMFLGVRADQCGETSAHSRVGGNPAFSKDWVSASAFAPMRFGGLEPAEARSGSEGGSRGRAESPLFPTQSNML